MPKTPDECPSWTEEGLKVKTGMVEEGASELHNSLEEGLVQCTGLDLRAENQISLLTSILGGKISKLDSWGGISSDTPPSNLLFHLYLIGYLPRLFDKCRF